MKVYLVGGAVRDQLLGYPIKEKDWVVVGGNAKTMLEQGYIQVGRDFPVFLHPKTKEEYALARIEKKSAPGYHGFQCEYGPKVSLEEDLLRRDLTINAIAMDEKGQLIDPFQGLQDLNAKLLRHVSPAFAEDPVRVLRVARFAARYHHLGFTLAPETKALMYNMVKQGELNHLVPERVWQEWQRSLEEQNPEIFITTLRACGALSVVLPEIEALFGVPNPPKHHPEIDTGIHTLLVLKAAVILSKEPLVRFAALVHDLGKALTPMHLWPKHTQHEVKGVDVIKSLCQRLRIPNEYRKLAIMGSEYHLIIHKIIGLKASTIVKTLEKLDAFRRPQYFENLLLVCEADSQGRGRQIIYNQAKKWQEVFSECSKVSAQDIIKQGYSGEAIKEQQYKLRVINTKKLIQSWNGDEK